MDIPAASTQSGLLLGRRVLVTGARGAIGSAIADSFGRHGAEVVRTDIVGADGVIMADASDEAAMASAFDQAGPLTDVVHAAGSLIVGEVATTSTADFRSAFDANVTSAFVVAREAARRLPRGGAITLLASQAGFRGSALWAVYCAAKAAVMRLGESLAQELGPRGVRVNCVCPGMVETPMAADVIAILARLRNDGPAAVRAGYEGKIPLGRFAAPREVAEVCAFLSSPMASYVSGMNLPVDGGELSA
jgi:NAD(P)-dependent dehydrogenase (short-subunit alcohol dehydrogenase family)